MTDCDHNWTYAECDQCDDPECYAVCEDCGEEERACEEND